jgi:T-complex protein 1 subunit gamma
MGCCGPRDPETGSCVARSGRLGEFCVSDGEKKAVADIVRTCLGPRAMLKMLMNPMGGLALTNDGNAILREINVNHPAAKSMIDLARTQDDEVGDGTTSVIILTGEVLAVVSPWLERHVHPTILIRGLYQARDDALTLLRERSRVVDESNREEMLTVVKASLGTKFVARWSDLMTGIALDAVTTVSVHRADGSREIDIKRFVRVEKIPGGEITESRVIRGVVLNKDITHPSMKRRLENPRVILLDTGIEYKKGENQTMVEALKEGDFERLLQIEEESIKEMVDSILKHKPDLVITEKGLDDRAQHYFVKAGVTALRRLRKTDNNRIARVTGATICSRADEIKEADVGTLCGLFEIEKIGDE